MHDLVIKSNNTLIDGKLTHAHVLIKDGLIAGIATDHPGDPESPVVDLGNKILMAGVIDPHVHINEPGRTGWEGFETATKAAIAGGITTLVDMPLNSSPVTTTVAALGEKLAATKNQLHANCGFWGGVVPGNEKQIEGLAEKGVLGFKAFLTHSGIDEFPNVTRSELEKVMPLIARYNLPLLVHCELSTRHSSAVDPHSYRDYLLSRPKEWEDRAIELMIELCERHNCRTHIVHLSSSNSLETIKRAKEKGLPLTVETAQHYLYFNSERIKDGQTQFKCAPPIRERDNNDQLLQALKEGIVDFVATDHSPAPPELKQLENGDFSQAWGGIASLQFALSALWTATKAKGCRATQIAQWLGEKPARLIGKQHQKGTIATGHDADLIAWDPDKKFIVREEMIQHKHKLTPYLHEELYGVVEQTYVGGKKVFEGDRFTKLNQGQIITR